MIMDLLVPVLHLHVSLDFLYLTLPNNNIPWSTSDIARISRGRGAMAAAVESSSEISPARKKELKV